MTKTIKTSALQTYAELLPVPVDTVDTAAIAVPIGAAVVIAL